MTVTQERLIASRYRLGQPLGRGGMGRVYRAYDTLLDRAVAVKLMYADAVSDAERQRACAAEARAAARLNHPGIVRILDSGLDGGQCFVVMELAEGRSLAAILDDAGRLPLPRALRLAAQAADALQAAHDAGVVHCDVKPANLMVDANDHVRLVDFGIARVAAGTTGLFDQTLQGSARYVAPEQVEGGRIDGRTDVYALGIVLYQMLAGVTPFEGGTLAAVLGRRLVVDPPPLSDHGTVASPEIEDVVRRALARSPDDRFPSAAAFADALRATPPDALAAPPRTASPSPRLSRAPLAAIFSASNAVAHRLANLQPRTVGLLAASLVLGLSMAALIAHANVQATAAEATTSERATSASAATPVPVAADAGVPPPPAIAPTAVPTVVPPPTPTAVSTAPPTPEPPASSDELDSVPGGWQPSALVVAPSASRPAASASDDERDAREGAKHRRAPQVEVLKSDPPAAAPKPHADKPERGPSQPAAKPEHPKSEGAAKPEKPSKPSGGPPKGQDKKR